MEYIYRRQSRINIVDNADSYVDVEKKSDEWFEKEIDEDCTIVVDNNCNNNNNNNNSNITMPSTDSTNSPTFQAEIKVTESRAETLLERLEKIAAWWYDFKMRECTYEERFIQCVRYYFSRYHGIERFVLIEPNNQSTSNRLGVSLRINDTKITTIIMVCDVKRVISSLKVACLIPNYSINLVDCYEFSEKNNDDDLYPIVDNENYVVNVDYDSFDRSEDYNFEKKTQTLDDFKFSHFDDPEGLCASILCVIYIIEAKLFIDLKKVSLALTLPELFASKQDNIINKGLKNIRFSKGNEESISVACPLVRRRVLSTSELDNPKLKTIATSEDTGFVQLRDINVIGGNNNNNNNNHNYPFIID